VGQVGHKNLFQMKELRLCVGSPDRPRSSVWKLWTRKGDAYIQSRMMGHDTKISLHESGLCQWSNTPEWVKKTGAKHLERHIVRWKRDNASTGIMIHVFRIVIPESELRTVSVEQNLTAVIWIDPPMAGCAVIIECFISPPSDTPIVTSDSGEKVFSLALKDSCWFVMFIRYQQIDGKNAETLRNGRHDLVRRATKDGISLKAEYRAVLFIESSNGARGMIEFVPV